MALVEAAAAPLPLPVVVYSDSGYCLLGLHKLASARQRSVTRSTERPLWLTCQSVLSDREVPITVRKCTSHGKDASQHSGITSWNSLADVAAKAAAHLPVASAIRKPWVAGEQDYSLLHRGLALRSDPRRHIRRAAAGVASAHSCTLTSGGIVARLFAEEPPPVNMGVVIDLRSAATAARNGAAHLMGFGVGMTSLSLRTPSRIYTKDPERAEFYSPKRNGKHVCPLCYAEECDSWHYLTTCPATASLRDLCRARVYHLVRRYGPASPPLLALLGEWVYRALGLPPPDDPASLWLESDPGPAVSTVRLLNFLPKEDGS